MNELSDKMAERATNFQATCLACSTVVLVLQAEAANWTRCPKCNRPFVPAEQMSQAMRPNRPAQMPLAPAENGVGPKPVPPSQVSLFASMIRLAVVLVRMWVILMSIRNLFWIRFYNLSDTAFYVLVILAMFRPNWFSSTEE